MAWPAVLGQYDIVDESGLRVRQSKSYGESCWKKKRTEAKGRRSMDAAGADVSWEAASGSRSSMSSAVSSQKEKAVVRKDSAETHLYESFQQNEMHEDGNECMEEFNIIPIALSETAGWHELFKMKFMCDKKCKKEGFKFFGITTILVEDEGRSHTISF